MTEGPRNMLGVFITLLYTYTMPINYYSSKPTSLRCHLMAKHCLEASRNQNPRQEICPHVAVKVWQRALEICWECSSLCYTHTQCQSSYYTSKPTSLRCHLMAKHCLKASRNQNPRQEICPHVAVKVWQRALEICWECSSLCYTHIQCQSTTILVSLHLWGATWWPNIAWKPAEIKIWGKKSAPMWL